MHTTNSETSRPTLETTASGTKDFILIDAAEVEITNEGVVDGCNIAAGEGVVSRACTDSRGANRSVSTCGQRTDAGLLVKILMD